MKKKTTVLFAAVICCSFFLGWHNVYAKSTDEYIKGLTPRRGIGGMASRPVEKPGEVQDKQLLQVAQVQPQKSTAEIAMQLQFGLDSATLLPAAVAELENLANALEDKKLRDSRFQIEGHTCDLGSAAHNMELSRRRAYAVTDWLSNHTSLSPEQFEVHWFGESCPLVPNRDEYARRKNRRVVIRNTGEVVEAAHSSSRPASLEIIHYTKNGEEIIGNGERIPSGGKYSLTFSTSSKPYAYVCQVDAKGNTAVLFPNRKYSGQSNPVQPKTRYSLPENGKTFFLDTTTGEEQIFILMLEKPLDDPQRVCSKMAAGKDSAPELVATRGIGGVIMAPPEAGTVQETTAPVMAEAKTINLCETMYGGRTRGLGGITRPAAETAETGDVSPVAEKSCEGIVLRRSFIHTP